MEACQIADGDWVTIHSLNEDGLLCAVAYSTTCLKNPGWVTFLSKNHAKHKIVKLHKPQKKLPAAQVTFTYLSNEKYDVVPLSRILRKHIRKLGNKFFFIAHKVFIENKLN